MVQASQKQQAAHRLPQKHNPAPKSILIQSREWAYKRIFGQAIAPTTIQDTIPYIAMYEDGVCYVSDGYYTKTIAITDTSFQLLDEKGKQGFFDKWCGLFSFLREPVTLQLTYMNTATDTRDIENMLSPHQSQAQDDFTHIRKEFYEMLKQKLVAAKKGLMRRRYATIGVYVKNIDEARSRLLGVERETIKILNSIGALAFPLDGKERLALLHKQMHPNPKHKFSMGRFDDKDGKKNSDDRNIISAFPADITAKVANDFSFAPTKDYIVPQAIIFSKNQFTLNYSATASTKNPKRNVRPSFAAMSYLEIDAERLPESFLTKMLDTEYPIAINIHIRPIDKAKAIKYAKNKLADVNAAKASKQKKAFRDKVDPDMLPPDIKMFSDAAQSLVQELQGDEEYFDMQFLVTHFSDNPQDLESRVLATKGLASQYSCNIKRLDYMQEQGFASYLALGKNQIPKQIVRKLYTTALAALIPFTTGEIFQKDPQAIYYGTNSISGVVILANRKLLKNPNSVVLGIPGSGKSFFVKREFIHVFLVTLDTILILDPEGEYSPLVKALGGVVIKISTSSNNHINPLDIVWDYGTTEEPLDPLGLKSEFVMSMMETITTRPHGLYDIEKSIIDRCVRKIYEKHCKNAIPENMPILSDLYDALQADFDPNDPINPTIKKMASNLAQALDMYVNGSYTMFNHRTNIDTTNRIICFDTKSLGGGMRPLAMLIIQDQIWGRISYNRSIGRGTWTYIDEFHLLLQHQQTAEYSVEMYKRFRKWSGIPTVITQNVKDFLRSSQAKNIIDNCEFVALLDQSPDDGLILMERLKLSEKQLAHVTNANVGDALIKYGNTIITATDRFPTDTQLYKLMTTKPSDLHEGVR
ncbi:MAG: DUF87 domain-containing protein [Defluviitaleaceae bacterium]|nr:DUF87 domain-containing protein [Defluviitaleaceae bacterium]